VTPSCTRRIAFLPTLLIGLVGATSLCAAEPEIRNLSLHGLQINGTTPLTIDGDGFGPNPRLLLPFPATVSLKPKATDKQAIFDIALGDDVTPGYHQLRVVSDSGVSLPIVIAVDRLAQKIITPSVEQLPVALHGSVSGSAIAETTFAGKAGQKVTIEVEAQRLGSKLRPVLHLYGPRRLQVAWAWGVPALRGDARIETTLPDDGIYRITLHDAEYQAPAPGFYRLRIGNWSYIDHVFPCVVGKESATVELLGSEAGQLGVPAARNSRWLPLGWPKGQSWSGPRPFVEVSSRIELLEKPSPGKPQELPAGSVAVSGKLLASFEEDRYRIPVTPGSKVRFELFAERLGSPLDATLILRRDNGMELTRVEDSPGTLDPSIEYTVPADVNVVVVGIVDSQGHGGPSAAYRLTVDPVTPTSARSDWEIVTPIQRLSLPAETRIVVPFWLERRGYLGGVDLTAVGLPPDIKLEGGKIPPGAEGTLISLVAAATSSVRNPAIVSFQGRTDDGRERAVIQKNHPLERVQPWLASEFALAGTTAKFKDYQVEWKLPKGDGALVLGRRWPLAVKTARPAPPGPVRLTLVTSQPPVLVNNQPDPNKTIRLEKPFELAAGAAEGENALLLPVELAGEVYDVALQTEFLSADRKSVIATLFTPVQRLPVRIPIAVKLPAPNRVDVKLDPKMATAIEIAGTIERLPGVTGDVQVTLAGQPAGVQAPPITVKDGTNDFRLKVTIPPNTAAGETRGLKLSGSIVPDPKQPNQRVRARDVELTLNIVSAKK